MRLWRASALAVLLIVVLTAGGAPQAADPRPYWLGPSYLGLELELVSPGSYVYGTCDPPPDGGCVPPYDVQNHRICERNPLTGGGQPNRVYRLRGGAIAAVQGAGVEVGVGRHTVVVFAHTRALAEQAAEALRRRSEDAPLTDLPAPLYPRAVLQELKRVALAMRRLGDMSAVARRLGMSAAAVRARNAIAVLLPPGALAAIRVPESPMERRTARSEGRLLHPGGRQKRRRAALRAAPGSGGPDRPPGARPHGSLLTSPS